MDDRRYFVGNQSLMDVNIHVEAYKKELIQKINEIDYQVIAEIIGALEVANKKKSDIYIIGNGGSAATAAHIVNDFGVGLRRKGKLNLRVCCLTDNVPTITAMSNDISYDDIFLAQLVDVINADDILIAASCSGNSPNIIKAVKYAKSKGAKVIALTGFDGGELYGLSDIQYHVSTEDGKYGIVEDMHLVFDHIIYEYFLKN